MPIAGWRSEGPRGRGSAGVEVWTVFYRNARADLVPPYYELSNGLAGGAGGMQMDWRTVLLLGAIDLRRLYSINGSPCLPALPCRPLVRSTRSPPPYFTPMHC